MKYNEKFSLSPLPPWLLEIGIVANHKSLLNGVGDIYSNNIPLPEMTMKNHEIQ